MVSGPRREELPLRGQPRCRPGEIPGGPISKTEQRRHRRYSLSLPVRVTPATADHVETSTSNISADGIRFLLPESCEPGTRLEWELTLPLELCRGNTIRVRCRGMVVRLESTGLPGRIGVAAHLQSYKFQKS